MEMDKGEYGEIDTVAVPLRSCGSLYVGLFTKILGVTSM